MVWTRKRHLGILNIYIRPEKTGKIQRNAEKREQKQKQILKRASYCTRRICFLNGSSGQTTERSCL